MFIERVSCSNFRNITMVDLNPNQQINVLVGDNAHGKTNILEAIYLLVAGSSFQTTSSSDMINWNEEEAFVKLRVKRKTMRHSLEMKITSSGKEVLVDGIKQKRLSDILGFLNVVLFVPDDLYLIKGSPSRRREFLDMEISQVLPTYYSLLQEYGRTLRHRNNLLKDIDNQKFKGTMLKIWDDKLVEIGVKIISRRLEALHKLSILARLSHRHLTKTRESLDIAYITSLGIQIDNPLECDIEELKELFYEKLIALRQQEIKRGLTLVGPHRDDVIFSINGYDAKKFASQGQQRTTVLATKLAELQYMKSETGELPILLLDDVLSELDTGRQKLLIEFVSKTVQTFITTTNLSGFSDEVLDRARKYHVYQGCIRQV